ncbi:hypothetical protein ACFL15_00080 [Patescibacteria group bacterium]
MTKKNLLNVKTILPTLMFILSFCTALKSVAEGPVSESIDATVKVSICGDSVVEGPEDCEGTNLDGETCITLGYASGDLSCDVACEFVRTGCIPPSSAPAAEDDRDDDDDDDDGSSDSSDSTATTIDQIVQRVIEQILPRLPELIQTFDLDEDGLITADELYSTVRKWVDSWGEVGTDEIPEDIKIASTCDLNGDRKCNLIDFSILMYYVER